MADDQSHTLELIAGHLITAVRPLTEAATSLGAFMRLMARIGFFASDVPPPYHQLATTVGDAVAALENLPPSPDMQDLLAVLEKAKAVYDSIQGLSAGPVPSGGRHGYAEEIGERLLSAATDFSREQPGGGNVLAMLKVRRCSCNTDATLVRPFFRWEECLSSSRAACRRVSTAGERTTSMTGCS
jgi:hypothetical protein